MAKGKWLTQSERQQIEQAYKSGDSIAAIADSLGKCREAIYRELRRGYTGEMDMNGRAGYSADVSQRKAYETKCRRSGRIPAKV